MVMLEFLYLDAGVHCALYHAGLTRLQRNEAHQKFLKDEIQVTYYYYILIGFLCAVMLSV